MGNGRRGDSRVAPDVGKLAVRGGHGPRSRASRGARRGACGFARRTGVILLFGMMTMAGLLTGSLIGRRLNKKHMKGVAAVVAARKLPSLDDRLRGLPCTLGDVVVLAHGEEAWLTGAVVFRERAPQEDHAGDAGRTVGALFLATERGPERAVYARPAPLLSLEWLWAVTDGSVSMGADLPSSVEIEGERFQRSRRLPLDLICVGTGAPDLGPSGTVGEYEGGAGATLLVIIGAQTTRVWRGRRLEGGMFEVLPGGNVVT